MINIKNVGLVTILAAATATTIILLNSTPTKRKNKRRVQVQVDPETINQLQVDLETRRKTILAEFENNGHKQIPQEMDKAMDYIVNQLTPESYPANIRLLASQIIQDYAIMYTNINNSDPAIRAIELAKEWLDFHSIDIGTQIEQINHRYALALRSRSIKEFRLLFEWLHAFNDNVRVQKSIYQNWILRNFQCACILGLWPEVLKYGRQLEQVNPESLAADGQQQAPLHPLHLFEYIALKLPNQSANFTQVYYNVEHYISRFDPRLAPPLKFTEWQIRACFTQIELGFSTNAKRNQELMTQIEKSQGRDPIKVPSSSKFMFVYGCLVQFPCFWVQLPSSNTKTQPVVLTGPWNDTEMVLTASYLRRMPPSAYVKVKRKKNVEGKMIQVVRSGLRLRLDRKLPYVNGDEKENVNQKENSPSSKKKLKDAWNWVGEFEHDEGLVECRESDLSDFAFRRRTDWKQSTLKFTCRTWKIRMAIGTPD